MRQYRDSEVFQLAALRLLWQTASVENVFDDEDMDRDFVETVLLSMESHPDDRNIQEWGLSLLSRLFHSTETENEKYREATLPSALLIAKNNGICTILSAMRNHLNGEKVQEVGSALLFQILFHERLIPDAICKGVTMRILDAMGSFPENISVLYNCSGVMQYLYNVGGVDTWINLNRAGGPTALVTVMKSHEAEEDLVKNCLFALLASLWNHEAAQYNDAVNNDLVIVVHSTMDLYPNNAGVQESCCGVFGCILDTADDDPPQEETETKRQHATSMLQSNVPESVVRAMKKHSDSPLVQEQAIGFLSSLSHVTGLPSILGLLPSIVPKECIEPTMDAMERFKYNEYLQGNCCVVLYNVFEKGNDEARSILFQAGAVESIVAALRSHKNDCCTTTVALGALHFAGPNAPGVARFRSEAIRIAVNTLDKFTGDSEEDRNLQKEAICLLDKF